jgi:DnaK suppressor protein
VKASDVKPKVKSAKVTVTVKVSKPVAPVKGVKVAPAPKQPTKPMPKPLPKPAANKTAKDVTPTLMVKTVPAAPLSKLSGTTSVSKAPAPISKKKTASVTIVIQPPTVVKPIKPAKTGPAAEPVAPVAKAVAAAPQLSSLGVPVRSGRPSSRLAQLTVPSMAQSVASTAAKASFTQMVAAQPIVSPLASSIKKDPKLANNWKKKTVAELTDAEVLAMSDQEYMNDTQMAYFRLKLLTLKNDILNSAGETTEHLREDTVVVPDPADRATIEEEHALELRTRDRERKLLKKIDQSINRIDAGDYGYCDETGEAIGVGRLLARPTATLSLEAQQRRELKQKMFGD